MIKDGGFKVRGTASIGLYETEESDGPSGISRIKEENRTGWCAESLSACSWNKALLYLQGRAVGRQARENDIQAWYAPGANLHRNPYTSRNFEYYSEDPILSGKLAAQVIKGAKNEGLICYLKHFAVSEGGKNPTQVNTWLTEQTMREIYLKAFELAVKGGKANGIMSAFNNIGDVYCGHNEALLQDILRTEWGFRGCVITDWWGEYMTIETCVYAGNDKMLMKKDTMQYVALGKGDSPMANAARVAVKNIIFAIVDSCVAGGLYEKTFANGETVEVGDEGGAAEETA
jgi:beta-glucosidase